MIQEHTFIRSPNIITVVEYFLGYSQFILDQETKSIQVLWGETLWGKTISKTGADRDVRPTGWTE
jgi:hypothetical protein